MRRRDLITLLGGTAAMVPIAARAQGAPMPVIGYLSANAPIPDLLKELRSGLAESGFYEGQTVVIEYRSAEGRYDRLPGLAADLIRRRVDVIVTGGGTLSARAAGAATSTIPIVALIGADPVAMGMVGSLSHPGGNVTGVAQLVTESDSKRLQLLHELVPAASTIAYLVNPTLPNVVRNTESIAADGRALGVTITVVKASTDGDLPAAFAAVSKSRVGALLVSADSYFFMRREEIVALSAGIAVPTMYFFREFVIAGGLISYGTRLADAYRQMGVYVARILKGAKPSDLPITQQSENIELVINLKTANALGLTIPPSLLARANEVIE